MGVTCEMKIVRRTTLTLKKHIFRSQGNTIFTLS
jgi:hypothetical protein